MDTGRIHTHEDEALYSVSGILTPQVADQRYEAGPESYVFMPRGLPHVCANLSEDEMRAIVLFDSPTLARLLRRMHGCRYFEVVDGDPRPVLTRTGEVLVHMVAESMPIDVAQ